MSDILTLALIRRLYAEGLLDLGDIGAIAEDVEPSDEMLAHRVRCTALEADQTPQAEWEAGRARERFQVIDGGNGD